MSIEERPDTQRIVEELEHLQEAIRASRTRRASVERAFAAHIDGIAPPPGRPAPQVSVADPPGPLTPVPPFHEARTPPAEDSAGDWTAMFADEPSAGAARPRPARRPASSAGVSLDAGVPAAPAPSADAPRQRPPADPPFRPVPVAARQAPATLPHPAPVEDIEPFAPVAPRSSGGDRWRAALVAIVAVAAVVAGFALRGRPPAQSTATSSPVQAAPADPEPPVSAPVPPPALVAPLNVEVTTTREVWLRLVVDGDLRLEKVVPAGQTYSLHGQDSIVVRAGDAGAVEVALNGGTAAVVGEDGQVVTKTFEKP